MKDFAPHEVEQIHAEMAEYVQNMALLGIKCIVLIDGRGLFHVGYGRETAPDAATLLADAYHSVKGHNARKAN